MIYTIKFRESAAKEWNKLDPSLRRQFAKKLKERAANPRIDAAKLKGIPNCYKIKLRAVGYRLIYEVLDEEIIIVVCAVGKRDRSEIYDIAMRRLGF